MANPVWEPFVTSLLKVLVHNHKQIHHICIMYIYIYDILYILLHERFNMSKQYVRHMINMNIFLSGKLTQKQWMAMVFKNSQQHETTKQSTKAH